MTISDLLTCEKKDVIINNKKLSLMIHAGYEFSDHYSKNLHNPVTRYCYLNQK